MRRWNMRHSVVLVCLLSCAALPACGGQGNGDADVDTDVDTDTDSDSDSDTDAGIIESLDIPYTPPQGGDASMALLDVYHRPDGKPRRLMVFVHGGSWVSGDKSNLATTQVMIPWFLDRGFVVAAPNFRLASPHGSPLEVSYAEQLADIAHALAWLHEHAETYGITQPGVLLVGFSSGAHLVALLAADGHYLQQVGLGSGHLLGAISLDVHAYDVPYAMQLMAGSELEDNIALIEHLFGDTETEQRVGSPASYIDQNSVAPSLLVSAEPSTEQTSKGYIARETTRRYAELLNAAGHTATSVHFDEETHTGLVMNFGVPGDGPTESTVAFLEGLSL